MRRRHLDLLRQATEQRLDLQKRVVLDQARAVDTLETALAGLANDVERECRWASDSATLMPALVTYLAECRSRAANLQDDLISARGELEARIEEARELYLEGRRYERLVELARMAEDRARAGRERRFLDWLGERRHGDVRNRGLGE
jgi:hypothetical protein